MGPGCDRAGGKIMPGRARYSPPRAVVPRIGSFVLRSPPGRGREPSSAPFAPGERPFPAALFYRDFSEEELSEYVTDRPSEIEEVDDEMLPFE